MKASELRIGNYVIEKGKIKPIHSVSNHNAKDYSKIEPIPLTEEWLVKFGFKKNEKNRFILMEGDVDILFNEDLNGWTCDGINFSINMTEYVHKLQNIYFALTGEELTINHP